MKLVIAGSVIIGIVGSGCGDRSSARETTNSGQLFSAQAFIVEFEKQTGHKLFDLASPAIPGLPRVHRLDVIDLHAPNNQPDESERELVSRYGHFSIFLYDSALNARWSLRGTEPDNRGIYWTHSVTERGPSAGESEWIAEKLYPENIVSSWGGSGKKLDDRWTRLDEVLSKIADATSP
jgi:hypothetical protein